MNVITIDGPSAAGKGTIGKKLSEHLGCFYLDTGLLYRQVAAWALEGEASLADEFSVMAILSQKLELLPLTGHNTALEELRTPRIADAASKVSIFKSVRSVVNQHQRERVASASGWVIVDGRDAGTVVFPEAVVKLFVTATPAVRAQRRYLQLLEQAHQPVNVAEVQEDVNQRDLRDQYREIAPLQPAPQAYIVDTSEETVDESVQRVLKYLEKYVVA